MSDPRESDIDDQDAIDDQEVKKEIDDAIAFLENLEKQDYQESSEELLELVKEGIAYHDDLLYSGSADFSIEFWGSLDQYLSESLVHTAERGSWEGSFSFFGEKMRYAADGTMGGEKITYDFAFDGSTVEELSETPEGPLLEIKNNLSDSRYNPHLDPRYWGWNVSGREALGQVVDSFDVESVRLGRLDDDDIYHVKGGVSGESTNVEMWINPSKGYRPERFDFYRHNGETEYRVTRTYSLREYVPDIWFPESATEVAREINPTTRASKTVLQRSVQISNVNINPSLSASSFRIPRWRGLTVDDRQNNTRYNVE